MKEDLKHYKTLLHDIKQRVRQGQLRASLLGYWTNDTRAATKRRMGSSGNPKVGK